jgi:hypothetical protein
MCTFRTCILLLPLTVTHCRTERARAASRQRSRSQSYSRSGAIRIRASSKSDAVLASRESRSMSGHPIRLPHIVNVIGDAIIRRQGQERGNIINRHHQCLRNQELKATIQKKYNVKIIDDEVQEPTTPLKSVSKNTWISWIKNGIGLRRRGNKNKGIVSSSSDNLDMNNMISTSVTSSHTTDNEVVLGTSKNNEFQSYSLEQEYLQTMIEGWFLGNYTVCRIIDNIISTHSYYQYTTLHYTIKVHLSMKFQKRILKVSFYMLVI